MRASSNCDEQPNISGRLSRGQQGFFHHATRCLRVYQIFTFM